MASALLSLRRRRFLTVRQPHATPLPLRGGQGEAAAGKSSPRPPFFTRARPTMARLRPSLLCVVVVVDEGDARGRRVVRAANGVGVSLSPRALEEVGVRLALHLLGDACANRRVLRVACGRAVLARTELVEFSLTRSHVLYSFRSGMSVCRSFGKTFIRSVAAASSAAAVLFPPPCPPVASDDEEVVAEREEREAKHQVDDAAERVPERVRGRPRERKHKPARRDCFSEHESVHRDAPFPFSSPDLRLRSQSDST